MSDIEALRIEEAELHCRLVALPRANPESKERAEVIHDRLPAIQSAKTSIARRAQEAAERKERKRIRRGRRRRAAA
jgi:hypothetical protein